MDGPRLETVSGYVLRVIRCVAVWKFAGAGEGSAFMDVATTPSQPKKIIFKIRKNKVSYGLVVVTFSVYNVGGLVVAGRRYL